MSSAASSRDPRTQITNALGESEAFMACQERISLAAKTDRPVIFIGERGTGKELAARRLHLLSRRWNEEYVTLNCASLSPTLIESELFGHEAGAFTGATRQRKGRFELAHEGSLFLDEVANIPMTVQEKILRTVEYGQMERVGNSTMLAVDVRLIAATNVDLRAMAARGDFRQDLLDRLCFEVIVLPPLRARREDILLLADHFARRMAAELGRSEAPTFSTQAATSLLAHTWRGNVRELKNVVERMVYRCADNMIETIVFDPFESQYLPHAQASQTDDMHLVQNSTKQREIEALKAPGGSSLPDDLATVPLQQAVRCLELARIRAALEEARFNQRRAAQLLGLTYHQFRGYWRRYSEALSPEAKP